MRSSGILLHITSLPGPEGTGTLGREAYQFADFLHRSGLTIWQVLPVGPVEYGESPYQSTCVFAGNPNMISIGMLAEEGILKETPVWPAWKDETEIPFEQVKKTHEKYLRLAFEQSSEKLAGETDAFIAREPWVCDFALFTALKDHFGGVMWTQWPDEEIRKRKPAAVHRYSEQLKQEIRYHIFVQYLFRKQWFRLKEYCGRLGIRIFGDMPIYVAEDSSDTWTRPEVFQLDPDGVPKRVAGVPPDLFTADGQMWGNPLYRWFSLKLHGYGWWVERMRGMSSLYDMIRIDHFIGFANYYSIPHGAPNARNGKWVIGPGKSLFKKLKKELPQMTIIAEDLGEVNDRVRRLLKWCGYPGMKVLSFGFDGGDDNPHYIENYPEHCIAYTGTHDNDTVIGWTEKSDEKSVKKAMRVLGFTEQEKAADAFVEGLFSCRADTVIVPLQDLLSLGGWARMNYPGSIGSNWKWRATQDQLTAGLEQRIVALNKKYHRGINE